MDTHSLLTGDPSRSSITVVRGLLRVVVVGFTVVSLSLVAGVGVAASSGKVGTSNTVKNSVIAVFSGHFDKTGFHEGNTAAEDKHGGGRGEDFCKPPKKHHHHATHDRENEACDTDDDSGSG